MAQIAIPLLLLGTAYLVSNDESKDDKQDQEGYQNLSDDDKGDLFVQAMIPSYRMRNQPI